MKLSKYTQVVYEISDLDKNSCKLIGEYAGYDVKLLNGSIYLTLADGGYTFLKTPLFGDVLVNIGKNRYIHKWLIKTRTPCSYNTVYQYSRVLCQGDSMYTYKTILPQFEGARRRFFPLRTKYPVSEHICHYSLQRYKQLPPKRTEYHYSEQTNNFLVTVS